MTKDLRERLAGLRVEMPASTAEMHLAAIERELTNPVPLRGTRRIRRLVGVLAASLTLLLPGAAIAADDAVPGDVLYPVKRSLEWAWSVVDPDVVARHRLDELEIVIDRGGPPVEIHARLQDAEAVIDDASVSLVRRLDRLTARLGESEGSYEHRSPAGPGEEPTSDGAPDRGDRGTGDTTLSEVPADDDRSPGVGPSGGGHPAEGSGGRSGTKQGRDGRPGQG